MKVINKNSDYKSNLRIIGSKGRKQNNRNKINCIKYNGDAEEVNKMDEDNGNNNNIPMQTQILNTDIIIRYFENLALIQLSEKPK